jgi:hypothetical protein
MNTRFHLLQFALCWTVRFARIQPVRRSRPGTAFLNQGVHILRNQIHHCLQLLRIHLRGAPKLET